MHSLDTFVKFPDDFKTHITKEISIFRSLLFTINNSKIKNNLYCLFCYMIFTGLQQRMLYHSHMERIYGIPNCYMLSDLSKHHISNFDIFNQIDFMENTLIVNINRYQNWLDKVDKCSDTTKAYICMIVSYFTGTEYENNEKLYKPYEEFTYYSLISKYIYIYSEIESNNESILTIDKKNQIISYINTHFKNLDKQYATIDPIFILFF